MVGINIFVKLIIMVFEVVVVFGMFSSFKNGMKGWLSRENIEVYLVIIKVIVLSFIMIGSMLNIILMVLCMFLLIIDWMDLIFVVLVKVSFMF